MKSEQRKVKRFGIEWSQTTAQRFHGSDRKRTKCCPWHRLKARLRSRNPNFRLRIWLQPQESKRFWLRLRLQKLWPRKTETILLFAQMYQWISIGDVLWNAIFAG